jgi:hypothetical protein
VKPIRIAIWLATAVFIVMLFAPLVRQMLAQIRLLSDAGPP